MKNSLGALWLKAINSHETFKVGSGAFLTKQKRKELWEHRDTLKGMVAEVAYQNLTAGRMVPRNPVLMNITNMDFNLCK